MSAVVLLFLVGLLLVLVLVLVLVRLLLLLLYKPLVHVFTLLDHCLPLPLHAHLALHLLPQLGSFPSNPEVILSVRRDFALPRSLSLALAPVDLLHKGLLLWQTPWHASWPPSSETRRGSADRVCCNRPVAGVSILFIDVANPRHGSGMVLGQGVGLSATEAALGAARVPLQAPVS